MEAGLAARLCRALRAARGEPLFSGGHAFDFSDDDGRNFIETLCSVLKKLDALSEGRLFVCHK
jgi:hypothetical protein